MGKIKAYICFLTGFVLTVSCNDGEGETAESTYMMPWQEVPAYSFSRNETSSVDLWECTLLRSSVHYLYGSFLQKAYASGIDGKERMRNAYIEGLNGSRLQSNVAQASSVRDKVLRDIDKLLDDTEMLSSSSVHERAAAPGIPGYIGYDAGDDSRSYATADGLIPAEIFTGIITGSVYLNKIINVHLDESHFNSEDQRNRHRDVVLPQGKNYTELEHHWDLAYGYFKNMQKIITSEGIPILKNRDRKLAEAFAWGRDALGRYDYQLLQEKMRQIREELSLIVAARAMFLLVGPNTLANVRSETPQFGFYFISQAYGLVYSLQFTRCPDGSPYVSYEQTQQLLNLFTMGNGLWDYERLKGGADVEGSLLNIATRIGKLYGLDVEDVMR